MTNPPLYQKSLFGHASICVNDINDKKDVQKKSSARSQRVSPFAGLTLDDGFDRYTITQDGIFWHRIMMQQNFKKIDDPKARRKFLRSVRSELRIKQGWRNQHLLTLELLLMKNM